MDLAQALAKDVQTLLEVVINGYWLALGAIFGSALAGAIFTMIVATAQAPMRARRRGAGKAWR